MRFKMKKIGAVTLAILLQVTPAVCADYTAAYDNNQKAVNVSGNSVPGKAVVFSVYNDTEALPILADAVKTEKDGNYSLTILLPKTLKGGRYYLKVSGEDTVYDFMYIDEDSIIPHLDKLNEAAAKGYNEFDSYLAENAGNLSIDYIIFEKYRDRIAKIFCLNLSEAGLTDANDFINQYYQAVALSKISLGEDFAEIMQQYGSYMQFAAQQIYDSLNTDAQKLFVARLKGDLLIHQTVEKVFKSEAIMAQVEASATWEELRNIILGIDAGGAKINDNFSVINPDTKNYDKLSDKNAFYKTLFSKKYSLKTLDTLVTQFEIVAADGVKIESDKKNNSGGGGTASAGNNWYNISGDTPIKLEEEDNVYRDTLTSTFSDIDGHWAQEDILALCNAGILNGYEDGTFKPDQTISRGEFVAILSRAFTLKNQGVEAGSFADVTAEDWYFKAVCEVQRAGIIQGYNGKFEPEKGITRQDLCVMIYRALNLTNEESPRFADNDDIADYAKNAVGCLAELGIVKGTDTGNFLPQGSATRAEIAAIINRCRRMEVSE